MMCVHIEQGELTDLRIPCEVGGMDKPLYLSLGAQVHGLSVTYRGHRHDHEDR